MNRKLKALREAIKMLLAMGVTAKAIAHGTGLGYHTVLRADPERFATARRRKAIPSSRGYKSDKM